MGELTAPGLGADYLNAWLAAIGVTVLVPGARLRWTADAVPKAHFDWPGERSLADLVTEALPSVAELEQRVIAALPQNIPAQQYRQAASLARQLRDETLGIITTDLAPGSKGEGLPTGPFNVGAPRGETLFTRLRACRRALKDGRSVSESVQATFDGRATRQGLNGLGFDYRRIAASVPGEAAKLVDPALECLCFYGLLLHPVGGNGRWMVQRGWRLKPHLAGAFCWPAWEPPLDRWGIDGLLDVVYPDMARQKSDDRRGIASIRRPWRRLGVTAMYSSVPFKRTGSSDTTRGYASKRLA